jgi:hypothetical protein
VERFKIEENKIAEKKTFYGIFLGEQIKPQHDALADALSNDTRIFFKFSREKVL